MAIKRTIERPCGVCGEKAYLATGAICRDCMALVEDGRLFREQQEATKTKTKVVLMVPEADRAHGLPFLHGPPSQTVRSLQEKFLALAHAMSQPEAGGTMWRNVQKLFTEKGSSEDRGLPRIFDAQQAEYLRMVFDTTYVALVQAKAAGADEGKSLLVGLAEGSVSLSELEDDQTRRAIQKQSHVDQLALVDGRKVGDGEE